MKPGLCYKYGKDFIWLYGEVRTLEGQDVLKTSNPGNRV